jgi:WXG100 family type VII secretion target
MSTYGYTGSSMQAASDSAGDLSKRIAQTLQTMDDETRSQLASWTGAAQEAYNLAYKQAKAQADLMPMTLAQAQQVLVSITGAYTNTEGRVTGSF